MNLNFNMNEIMNQKRTLSGFEGPEKVLEIWFRSCSCTSCTNDCNASCNTSCDTIRSNPSLLFQSMESESDCSQENVSFGFRKFTWNQWQDMLELVQCRILSVTKNQFFDAYLLSESSLFVYPSKIILKTCGTTTLLNAIPKILEMAMECELKHIDALFYSRKAFMFPENQIHPHGNWEQEVYFLDSLFSQKKEYETGGYTLGKLNGEHWCLYTVTPLNSMENTVSKLNSFYSSPPTSEYDFNEFHGSCSELQDMTLEIMMTQLDSSVMKEFWKNFGETSSIKQKILNLYPSAIVDEYQFDPCGYSLNGLLNESYFTIHITPEEHCSYASFETSIPFDLEMESSHESIQHLVETIVSLFQPGSFSVTLFRLSDPKSESKMSLWTNGRLSQEFKCCDVVFQSVSRWDLEFTHFIKRLR